METTEYAKIPSNSSIIIPKNSLIDDIYKSKAIEHIINEVKKMPEYSKYRNDIELVRYVSTLVENIILEKKSGDKKKEIVTQAMIKIFNLSATEQKTLSDIIEFLANNKKIKKLSIYKKYLKPFGNFILKKLL
jgi:hypothetical protein